MILAAELASARPILRCAFRLGSVFSRSVTVLVAGPCTGPFGAPSIKSRPCPHGLLLNIPDTPGGPP
eukprot:4051147-Heterocapsa_arctica.AAC.1